MKKLFLPFIFAFAIACNNPINPSEPSITKPTANPIANVGLDTNFHNGDIIFQTSNSGQSLAIQLATHSKYSHCGLLFNDNGDWFVYEAVQPVKITPVKEWIDRGDDHYFAVERLKNADSLLTENAVQKMRSFANKNLGKNYDLAFDWSDERMYCSEFVWKTYHEGTGLEIGALKKLGDFDLTNPIVKKKLNERYGNKIPLNEPMISPGNIFDCPLLIKVRG
jgi:hypothetical protein